MTTASRAQLTTLHTIAERGGEMNSFAGQKGFYCNSVAPLVTAGYLIWKQACEGCATGASECTQQLSGQRGGNCCYGRVQMTKDGWDLHQQQQY